MTEHTIKGNINVFEVIENFTSKPENNININSVVIDKKDKEADVQFNIVVEYDVPETLHKLRINISNL